MIEFNMQSKVSLLRITSILVFTMLMWTSFVGCLPKRERAIIKDIEVDLSIIRFDQALMNLDSTWTEEDLRINYPFIFPFYKNEILAISDDDDSSFIDFVNNYAIQELLTKSSATFEQDDKIEKELERAFKFVKYYFPNRPLPEVFTFISEFGYANVTYENLLGIGLDMYLGREYKYYASLGFPNYVTDKFEQEYIVPNTMRAYATHLYGEITPGEELLSMMIHKGKLLYFLDAVLPETQAELKIGYSSEQLSWCENNEAEIWNYFISNDYLFNNKFLEVNKYVNDGPTTPGMPTESPGNIGSWLGWQIVTSYMNRNPAVTLADLMGNSDHRLLFEQSKYKPKK